MKYEIIMQSPDKFSEKETGDFIAFVLAGGEVMSAKLEERVRQAERLVMLRVAGCLGGIGALKQPNGSYRSRVASASGTCVPVNEYPVELGWIFILPSHRGNGLASRVVEAALSIANGIGVFATSRCDNVPMHKALQKHGFVPMGKPYPSRRGNHELQLFLRGGREP